MKEINRFSLFGVQLFPSSGSCRTPH